MASKLELEFNDLDPTNLEAITAHALARIRAAEWSDDLGRMLATMVATNHTDEDLQRYLDRVGRELERTQP